MLEHAKWLINLGLYLKISILQVTLLPLSYNKSQLVESLF